MKIKVDFIGNKWYGYSVVANSVYVSDVTGFEAMNILYNQESDKLHKDHNLVVMCQRTDLPYCAFVANTAMWLGNFASAKFKWFSIDREYLEELLNES